MITYVSIFQKLVWPTFKYTYPLGENRGGGVNLPFVASPSSTPFQNEPAWNASLARTGVLPTSRTLPYPSLENWTTAPVPPASRSGRGSFNNSIPTTVSWYSGVAYFLATCPTTLSCWFVVSPCVQEGESVRWPELSNPFCEPGAPWMSIITLSPVALAHSMALSRYGAAPWMYGSLNFWKAQSMMTRN